MMASISEYSRPVSNNSESVQLQIALEDSQKNGQIHLGKHGGRNYRERETKESLVLVRIITEKNL